MWLLLLSSLLLSPAVASELPTSDEAAAVARLKAIRAYKSRRLQVRAYSEMTGGGSNIMNTGSLSAGQIWVDPVRTVHTWGIFLGPTRVTMPELYEITGNQLAYQDLEQRLLVHRRISAGLYGLGAVGVVAALGGLVGRSKATTSNELRRYNSLTGIGVVTAVVGLSVGGIPASRADRLENDPSTTLKPMDAQGMVDAYNERLRVNLGLTATDATLIELGEISSSQSPLTSP